MFNRQLTVISGEKNCAAAISTFSPFGTKESFNGILMAFNGEQNKQLTAINGKQWHSMENHNFQILMYIHSSVHGRHYRILFFYGF